MELDFIQPFADTGLGNSAYFFSSHETKKGVMTDPLRDMDRYLHAASTNGKRTNLRLYDANPGEG